MDRTSYGRSRSRCTVITALPLAWSLAWCLAWRRAWRAGALGHGGQPQAQPAAGSGVGAARRTGRQLCRPQSRPPQRRQSSDVLMSIRAIKAPSDLDKPNCTDTTWSSDTPLHANSQSSITIYIYQSSCISPTGSLQNVGFCVLFFTPTRAGARSCWLSRSRSLS